jgi:hypothetical protein
VSEEPSGDSPETAVDDTSAQPAEQATSAPRYGRPRRAPRYGSFVVTGALAGIVLGVVLFLS